MVLTFGILFGEYFAEEGKRIVFEYCGGKELKVEIEHQLTCWMSFKQLLNKSTMKISFWKYPWIGILDIEVKENTWSGVSAWAK